MTAKKIKKKPVNWDLMLKTGMMVLVVVIATILIPRERSHIYRYQIGEITRSAIIAPYDFDILKPEDVIEAEKREALKRVPFVFNHDPDAEIRSTQDIEQFFRMASALKQRYQSLKKSREDRNLYRYNVERFEEQNKRVRSDSTAFYQLISQFRQDYNIDMESNLYRGLYDPAKSPLPDLDKLKAQFLQEINQYMSKGIVDISLEDIISTQIAISRAGEEIYRSTSEIYDRDKAINTLSQSLKTTEDELSFENKQMLFQISRIFIRPNLIYDKERTIRRQQDAISRVPIVDGKVLKNEKIVDANTRVTPQIYRKLYSLNVAESKRNQNAFGRAYFMGFFGDLLIMGLLYTIFFLFIYHFRKEIYSDRKNIFLIVINQLIVLGLGYLISSLNQAAFMAVPVTLLAMIVSIFYDERVAIFSTVPIILMLSYIFGNPFHFTVVHMLPALISTISIKKLRSRDQIFQPLIWVFLSYILGLIALELVSFSSFAEFTRGILFAFINTVGSVLAAYGLVSVFERLLNITTDMTLLELTDLNKPLLKELAVKAPGTFNHSVMVGTLVDTVAEAIGANNLLARVGAYYHDIGKIAKSNYFAENQRDENRLEKLKPHMAAKVVINHVRTGVELAEQYNLPKIVVDFIPMHHGTQIVKFFYDRAMDQAEDPAEVKESDFRYPGPKPNTKETALVMIAEACEAAIKALNKPTDSDIENRVNLIIKTRMDEGQLSDCPLTFHDITVIRESLIRQFISMYHHRPEYPGQQKSETAK
ncbi:MAG: 7TM receptor with intracellular metal dependent phosphohydrolase [Marinimicrobia bacterium 46_43]|nr:MAG: 7TM receptor with intracellular metal dependent phosphohydrolase [Marinimicrobia bacterium 46_43]